MPSDVESIVSNIDAAFAKRAYPGDTNITQEAPGHPEHEANSIAKFFRGKRWQDVTWKSIAGNPDLDPHGFVFLLTPEAFAYYLPAFLKESLTADRAPELAESVLFALAQYDDCDASQRRRADERMALFDDKERAVIKRALERIAARMQ
jgi:hypothetical protein